MADHIVTDPNGRKRIVNCCTRCGKITEGVHTCTPSTRKKNPKCPKCGCDGVLNTANTDNGTASSWTCWAWQCRHSWKTPNAELRGASQYGEASLSNAVLGADAPEGN